MSVTDRKIEIEAPVSLMGLFCDDSDSDCDNEQNFEQTYEEQTISICQYNLTIRQFCWHQANANKVWPGTFNLAEFVMKHRNRYSSFGHTLELGAATGALSIFMMKALPGIELMTSDIDDNREVESNVKYNFEKNGLLPVRHIPHTWGTPWEWEAGPKPLPRFRLVIASDILLYVSAYPALVTTLVTLFGEPGSDTGGKAVEFLMSWNRRIAESDKFFDLMRNAGFYVHHHGKCIYSFYRDASVMNGMIHGC